MKEEENVEMKEEKGLLEEFLDASANPNSLYVHSLHNLSSNGYSEYIFRRLSREVFKIDIPHEQPLNYKQGKNKHYQEITFNGVKNVKFVRAYGFQHIQNVIRKLKTGRCDYDYVELMACPSGCLNGGGQIKPEMMATETKLEPIEVLASVESNQMEMNGKRQLFDQGWYSNFDNLINQVCEAYKNDWFKCTFHPIPPENE